MSQLRRRIVSRTTSRRRTGSCPSGRSRPAAAEPAPDSWPRGFGTTSVGSHAGTPPRSQPDQLAAQIPAVNATAVAVSRAGHDVVVSRALATNELRNELWLRRGPSVRAATAARGRLLHSPTWCDRSASMRMMKLPVAFWIPYTYAVPTPDPQSRHPARRLSLTHITPHRTEAELSGPRAKDLRAWTHKPIVRGAVRQRRAMSGRAYNAPLAEDAL